MASRNLIEKYLKMVIQGTTQTGTLIFTGNSSGPINYSLNKVGNTYTLTIGGPCMGIVNQNQPLTAPNIPGLVITNAIIQQIPVISSDGAIVSEVIGIIMISDTGITIYPSIEGNPFVEDSVNPQGWNNGFVINFSI